MPASILRDPSLSAQARVLYAILAAKAWSALPLPDWSEDFGVSRLELARQMGLSTRWVQPYRRELVNAGLLIVVSPMEGGRGRGLDSMEAVHRLASRRGVQNRDVQLTAGARKALGLLSEQYLPLRELAACLGITVRTAQRYRMELVRAGYDLPKRPLTRSCRS